MHDSKEINIDYKRKLIYLTSLFFMWGFITSLNDILIPYFKNAFDLSYTQAMLTQFCFFGAYFVVSIPAGKLVGRIGFKNGIVTGLVIAGLGCFLFYPSALQASYSLFLFSLFILASGVTLLQVAANPLVNLLGPQKSAPARLVSTQAFNSLGTTLAPMFGAYLLFSGSASDLGLDSVKIPYLSLSGALFLMAALFVKMSLPTPKLETPTSASAQPPKLTSEHRHLWLGAIGIFVYVGAEVSIGSFLVSFMHDPNIAVLNEAQAAQYVAYYWGGAMVGRFVGAVIMKKVQAAHLLSFNATSAIILLILAIFSSGSLAMWSLLLIGLFNSIMFPTIFSLSLNGLGKCTSQGSGILCLAIVGGAIVPLLQGIFADNIGLQPAFVIPIFCYLFIVYYGLKGHRPKAQTAHLEVQ